MARAKPKKKEEPEMIGPPLIPGLPPFFRWMGYFKVGPGDTLKDIEEAQKLRAFETMRKFKDSEDD